MVVGTRYSNSNRVDRRYVIPFLILRSTADLGKQYESPGLQTNVRPSKVTYDPLAAPASPSHNQLSGYFLLADRSTKVATSDQKRKILKAMKMGTTEFLVLLILSEKDCYGYEIRSDVQHRSQNFFELKQGFLYPALKRMARDKLITAYWQNSDRGGPRCKYYSLTSSGRLRLQAFQEAWQEFDIRLNRILALSRALPSTDQGRKTVSGVA